MSSFPQHIRLRLFSSYCTRWVYGAASLALAILPITVFFVFMQKYFISGMVAGAIKG